MLLHWPCSTASQKLAELPAGTRVIYGDADEVVDPLAIRDWLAAQGIADMLARPELLPVVRALCGEVMAVARAEGVWQAAMEGGDPNQGKYQTAYNQSLKTLVALEEEQERRLILAKDYISSKEAGEAMRELASGVVNRLDKLALDVAEGCNPENPAKAVKVLEAWVRRVKAELSSADEQG